MTHIKRLGIPGMWKMRRKGDKFAATPRPGPHAKRECIPLRMLLRNVLGLADNAKEARDILNRKLVLVDQKPRKDDHFPVGLMDVISIPQVKKHYAILPGKGGLVPGEIREADASQKLCRISGKTTLKKGIQQLNLHDSRNILVKKDSYSVGDSITISIPGQKVLKHHRFEKGAHCIVTAGRNAGTRGRIKDIERKQHMLEKSTVILESGKKDIKTLRDYIFITEDPEAKK